MDALHIEQAGAGFFAGVDAVWADARWPWAVTQTANIVILTFMDFVGGYISLGEQCQTPRLEGSWLLGRK